MNRVDLQWQARWEMLKEIVDSQRREYAERLRPGHECYQDIYLAMQNIERMVAPCLSRAIKPFTSPATGDPRAVFDSLPVLPELPVEKVLEEKK